MGIVERTRQVIGARRCVHRRRRPSRVDLDCSPWNTGDCSQVTRRSRRSATASGGYGFESAWSASTGGFSSYESEPSYQTSTLKSAGLSDGARTAPDVSFDADPSSGVSVYDSVGYDGQAGWFQVGGTSLAAPAWAGLIAIVDQGLATGGKGSLTPTEVLTDLYSLPSSDFNDITTGSNGYSASAGYDLVTGLGSPRQPVGCGGAG